MLISIIKPNNNLLNMNCIGRCAKYGRHDLLELFIQNGCDINEKDKNGQTPIYRAIEYCREDSLKELILKGAKKEYLR